MNLIVATLIGSFDSSDDEPRARPSTAAPLHGLALGVLPGEEDDAETWRLAGCADQSASPAAGASNQLPGRQRRLTFDTSS